MVIDCVFVYLAQKRVLSNQYSLIEQFVMGVLRKAFWVSSTTTTTLCQVISLDSSVVGLSSYDLETIF